MKQNRLGCLTPMAMIATVITLLAIGGMAFVNGSDFFSAGSLNAQGSGGTLGGVRSHAEIGDDCAKCHPALWEPDTMGDRCVVCHKDVLVQLAFPNSLHGAIRSEVSKINCRSCHSEHKGPDAPLTDAHLTNFPHDPMGFSLTSHKKRADGVLFACADCHVNSFIDFQQTQCAACHRQMDAVFTTAHAIEFGENCMACHDGVETIGKAFDHSKSTFALAGKHLDVRCAECHTNARSRADLKTAPTACESCHQKDDAHQGRYGLTCGNCHNPAGWRDNLKFDHNLSTFKLEGKHIGVACEKCHTNPAQFAGIASDCVSCHSKDDAHNGQFGTTCAICHNVSDWKDVHIDHSLFSFKLDGTHVNVPCLSCHVNNVLKGTPTQCNACHAQDDAHHGQFGTDCAKCHSTAAWKPSTFDHNLAAFKLDGAHVNVACLSCHKNGQFKGTPQNCFGCHAGNDAHHGQFGTDCAKCHTTAAWKPAFFNHNLSVFKLTGAHVNVACLSCHKNGVFKGTPQNCVGCHASNDAHHGQVGTDCAKCHTTAAWKPAFFDHNLSAFKLTGAHVNVSCLSCHKNGQFKGTPQDCFSCHAGNDAHHGQFGTACAQCHNTAAWKPASFDHNLSSFKLTGAHGGVACLSCHQNGKFKGTPSDCYSCHAGKDAHHGQFGTNCAQCHSTSAWKPATFDHNLSSFKLTGAHTNVSCNTCHSNGVFKGTPSQCGVCHAADDAHGGRFGAFCGQCHTTSGWKPATFDHNLASFKLTGAHAGAACSSCHKNGQFKGTPSDCYSCHGGQDAHNGKFGANCSQCHSTSAWKPASFNHNLSGFPLAGRHANVACSSCHPGGRYAGTPSACAACHGEPAFHSGMFSSNCDQCHSANNWNGSYNGSHPSISNDEGGSGVNHGGQGCRSCHTSSLHDATCTACHDGNGDDGGDD